jgi:hypothetical protein
MKQSGTVLPAPLPDPSDANALSTALYKAGVDDGKFNVETLFDTLFSPDVHMHAMMAVGQQYGGAGESAYHQVFGRMVVDVGGSGASFEDKAQPMHDMGTMKGMDMKGMNVPSPAAHRI